MDNPFGYVIAAIILFGFVRRLLVALFEHDFEDKQARSWEEFKKDIEWRLFK